MYAPEDRDQALVKTPYGQGLVVRTRKSPRSTMHEIELLDWTQRESTGNRSPKRPSMLYSPSNFPSIEPVVGSDVSTAYGRGKVTHIRQDSQMAVIQITSWRLAGRSTVTCYLSTKSIKVLRPKKIFEMSVFEKVEHAQQLKDQASKLFAEKKYIDALQLYAEAVDAVRYVQHKKDSTNELRADLLLVMITCCNNAATCCLHLNEWDRAQKFGKNALVLLEALYDKKGNSYILKLLNREGTSDSKLFGTWMVKSHLVIARGLAERHDIQDAMANLKKAQEMINEFKRDGDPMFRQLQSQEKEVRKLFASCKDRLKAERKKEKQRARAMFDTSDEKKESECKGSSGTSSVPTKSKDTLGHSAVELLPSQIAGRSIQENEHSTQDRSTSKSFEKKRVSFADGTAPGDVDDNAKPSFLEEHAEALLIIGGLALGSLCVHLLFGKRR